MAKIESFCALRPDPFYADQLVFPPNERVFFFNIGEKEMPLLPLKDQLETPARRRPETPEGQEAAYLEISITIGKLLEMGRITLENEPGIYIYEIVHRNYRQTGIWALTSIQDYIDGKIMLHELTLADSERRICNYIKYTGLEGSPVLLTYQPQIAINRIIANVCASEKKTTIGNKKAMHRLWKIQDKAIVEELITCFAKIDRAYLADGHHRLAATARLAKESETNTFFSSLYIASDQLRIIDYHRVFIPENALDSKALLGKLLELGEVVPSMGNQPVNPNQANMIGICLDSNWYEFVPKVNADLDVVFLHEQILIEVFGVTNPRTDSRLKFIGGETAMEEMIAMLKKVPIAVGFTLYPLTVNQLIEAANAGQILPPKSTWIDPKVPYGLLMYQHNQIEKEYYNSTLSLAKNNESR